MESKISNFDNKELNKLRMVFEQTPGAIFILDREFRFEYVNPSFTKLSGYSEAELIGNTVGELFYHKDLPESRKEIVESLIKGEKWQGELLTFNKNGSTYWANTLAAPYKDEDGNIDGYVIIQQDITDKKNIENALFESEAKYKTLVENSHDGIMIIRDSKILYANDTICDMLGYCLTNQTVDIIHPDDRAKMLTIGERRRNGDMSTIHESLRLIAKNGEIKECETASTMVEFNGEWGAFYTVHDVTERNRFEEELKNSEEKYRQLFAAESDAIFMIDADTGQILDVNPATIAIYGYSYDELLKMKNTDVSAEPEKTKEATSKNLTRVPYRLHKRKDGTIFPVELSAGFTEFKNRKIQIVTSRDITERIKTQEALTKSEQKYREFADFLPQTVYELDINGNLLYVNKSGMEVFGVSEADYGKSIFNCFVPEDHERMFDNLKITTRVRKPNAVNEYTAIHPDGSTFPVIIYGLSVFQEGIPIGTRGMIVDISERKAMENALRESELKYKTLIEKANDGIVITQDGKLKFMNKTMCDMVLYTEEEIIDRSFLEMVVEEDHQVMIDFHNRRMRGEIFTSLYRSRFIRKDGKIITVELNARTSDYNGKPAAFIIIRDITERIIIEKELENAKTKLERMNNELEQRVKESSESLTEARTQLINLQKENLQSQFDVLKQQVNPHFLFNSLNVLTSLIKLEPDLAEKFSEQLSKVYRYVLENKDNELIDLNTELNFLDAYIFLLNIRFVDKLKVIINIPTDRRCDQIIPLAMQLLIENAIKHNTMSKSEPLTIDIFIDSDNFLNIVNNLQERPSQLVSTGVGLKNIQNRYLLLNNTEPVFEKTQTHFTAKVPLVIVGY